MCKNWYLRIILASLVDCLKLSWLFEKSTKKPRRKRSLIFQLFTVCFVAEPILMVPCLKGLGVVSGNSPSASHRELQVWGIFSALRSGDMQHDAKAHSLSVGYLSQFKHYLRKLLLSHGNLFYTGC